MSADPIVSVVMPFRDTDPRFLREAVESVVAQSFADWELLLVDDDSGAASRDAALALARKQGERVRYLRHPEGKWLGSSGARQFGIDRSSTPLVALLDADDVWVPEKLAEQVAILDRNERVAMLYGNTVYWRSWSDGAKGGDSVPRLGLSPDRVYEPRALVAPFLDGRAAVPCTGSVLVRREAIEACGGFEDRFTGMYDDQVFYIKLAVRFPVYVSGTCWDRYRQHEASLLSTTRRSGELMAARLEFLDWVGTYLDEEGIDDPRIAVALRRQIWNCRPNASEAGRLARKWLLRLESVALPWPVRRAAWLRGSPHR